MRDDDDASAHALFSCPLFDGKKFKRDDGETLTRQKRRRTCVAMVEKFPEYAVYSAKMVLVRSLRVAATNAYMSGMTRCVAHRKKMRTKRKAPHSLFFPNKGRKKNSIQIERIIHDGRAKRISKVPHYTSQTKRKRTAAEEEEEDMRMDRHKNRKHNSWSSRYYCLLTLLLAFQ